ncbi:hypothetical protein DFQ04_1140 [Algoriphagus boseongensis]|uniref:Uncharacterized protein n=1 Tax=Algoriphagus boseongensis TaxID=1442587 RepID=A0A4R6TAT7_9BACT|nr:hypothetical protein [Algoriphagus boseongensis]TDQ19319.1 hypothetical protein DFQ04_1140 [Algoriphagus boseongensis]
MAKTIQALCFLFFLTSTISLAQSKDFLLLKRGGNQKTQIRYYVGEDLTYKSKKLDYFVTDRIVEFDKDFIYLTENILSPDDLVEIDIRNKDPRNRTLRNLSSLFLGSGILLIGVETINSIYQDEKFQIDGGVATVSGILVGTGLAMLPLRYKTFKQGNGNRAQIILMRLD